MLNLDTHILIFALTDQLTSKERKLLAADEWGICDIVIWEIAKLVERGRVQLDLNDPKFLRVLQAITVWPITLDTCRAIDQLDFDSDPADELIAATSVVHDAPLVTRDHRLRKSKVVPIAR